jgi:hypothetical protein
MSEVARHDLARAVQEAATVLDVPVTGPYAVVAIDNLVDDECTVASLSRRLAGVRIGLAGTHAHGRRTACPGHRISGCRSFSATT